MKHLLSIIIILTLSFQGFSQKKTKKKTKPKTTKVAQDVVVEEMIVKEEPLVIDTLRISAGKKYVLIVDVDQYSGRSNVDLANPDNSEQIELKKNFEKESLEIINIRKYTYVIFNNQQTLDISVDGQSYKSLVYWSGKMKDNVKVREGNKMATEFVSEQVGGKKESSYVINNRKYKKEVASLLSKNKVTAKSKEVLNVALAGIIMPFSDIKEDDAVVFKQPNTKVKTIDSYITNKKGTKIPLKSIVLNENGQPSLIKNFNREGQETSKTIFIYKEGLLTTVLKNDQVSHTITYDDSKMISTEKVGDANETRISWLENGKLLQKSYTLMIDDKFAYMNSFTEEKIENNCTAYYINNVVWTRNCGSQPNIYPFTHKYTSYQNGNVLQFRKSKIEKKGNTTFEKYYSEAEQETENDNFKFFGTIQLNDHNLVDSYNFTKNNTNQIIKIDYTYYQ
ncbi:MAG: hypothetical protein ABI892_18020 [Flavobacterium sp.]